MITQHISRPNTVRPSLGAEATVRNYTILQARIQNRQKQTAGEWNNLIRNVLDEIDAEIRHATGLPSKNAPLSFEEYQEWTRALGQIKGWNIEGGWPVTASGQVEKPTSKPQKTVTR
jgi:hypothetical protein